MVASVKFMDRSVVADARAIDRANQEAGIAVALCGGQRSACRVEAGGLVVGIGECEVGIVLDQDGIGLLPLIVKAGANGVPALEGLDAFCKLEDRCVNATKASLAGRPLSRSIGSTPRGLGKSV